MPKRARYSYKDLLKHSRDGKTNGQIGAIYGISASAVSWAIKRGKQQLETRGVVATQAQAMNQANSVAVERLERQLSMLEEENEFTVLKMRALDPDTAEIERHVDCPECKCGFAIQVTDKESVMKSRMVLQDRMVKNSAEIRQQIEKIKGVLKEAYNIEQVEQFKAIILEEIGNESPETQRRIFERIRQRRTTGRSVAGSRRDNGSGTDGVVADIGVESVAQVT
jgi:hypothetical protein